MNFTRKKPQGEFKHGIALLSDPQLSRLTIWSGIFQLNGLAAYTPCSNLKKYLFLYQPERLSELLGRNSEKPFKPWEKVIIVIISCLVYQILYRIAFVNHSGDYLFHTHWMYIGLDICTGFSWKQQPKICWRYVELLRHAFYGDIFFVMCSYISFNSLKIIFHIRARFLDQFLQHGHKATVHL